MKKFCRFEAVISYIHENKEIQLYSKIHVTKKKNIS